MSARSRVLRSLIALATIPALALAACSSDESAPAPATTSSVAVTSSSSFSSSTTSTTSATPTSESASSVESTPEPPPPPPPPVDAMTGAAEVSPNVVVAVKIDNTVKGKQYGISAADVVYVEMVEGNLSRLIALFHTTLPEEVGPIRSVRTTDPEVLTAYGTPALMFSGGAGGPLNKLAQSVVVDAGGTKIDAYWRSSAASAPYNVHGNVAKVATGVAGISTPSSPGFTFGADYAPLSQQRDITTITAQFSNTISFRWSGGAYQYIRRDAVQTDAVGGAAIQADNVLVQHVVANRDGTVDPAGNPSYETTTVGTGAFTLYRDGKAIDGTWTRADASSPTSYLDGNGSPVLFRPGKTWVVLAPEQISTSES